MVVKPIHTNTHIYKFESKLDSLQMLSEHSSTLSLYRRNCLKIDYEKIINNFSSKNMLNLSYEI